VSAAERSALCTVGFNERYSNGVNVIMSHQSDGFFGDIYHVDAHYIRRRGIPIGSWFTESDIAGGGALRHRRSHDRPGAVLPRLPTGTGSHRRRALISALTPITRTWRCG